MNIVYADDIEELDLPGRKLKWLFNKETGLSDSFTMNVVEIAPGNVVKPAHSHTDSEEVVYIMSGEGSAYVDGEVKPIKPHTAILFSKGSVHMLKNSGSEPMKVVCFFTPPAELSNYSYFEDIEFPEVEN